MASDDASTRRCTCYSDAEITRWDGDLLCPHAPKVVVQNALIEAGERLAHIAAKCDQYQNAPRLCEAEQHAVLEFIHREATRRTRDGE